MREVFFSAVRSVIEAMARRNPLVLVFEDIHWADHGMLDLIEYLAQWVRGPLMLLCLARDELLERRAAVGWRAPRGDLDPARPADRRADPRAGRRRWSAARQRGQRRRRRGRRARRRQPVLRRGDGAPARRRGAAASCSSCPTPCRACSPRGSTRSSPRSACWSSTRRSWAARSGRERSTMAGQSETATREALQSLQEKDIIVPDVGVRLAGEREYAFKHVLIRDVAYGMLPQGGPRAQALRHRPLHRGPRRRAHRRGRRAAGRALRARRDPHRRGRHGGRRRRADPPQGAALPGGARATPPPRSTPTPRRSTTTRRRRRSTARTTPARSRA